MAKDATRKVTIAALHRLLTALVREGELEVDDEASVEELATRLIDSGERKMLADWLEKQDEVVEIYVDTEALESRWKHAFHQATGVTTARNRQIENRAAISAHEPALAEAIIADPADLDARAVYADWLLERGDPRGELMLLQLAKARTGKQKTKERAREKELLATHRRHFYGALTMEKEAGSERVVIELENGFFTRAEVPDEHAFRKLLELESARFLTSLEIDCRMVDPIDDVLAKKTLPLALRSFVIALPRTIRMYGRTTVVGELDLGRALRGLRHLDHLEIHATRIRLDSLPKLPLTSLILDAERLDLGPKVFDQLDALTELDLSAGRVDGSEALQHLFRKSIPSLTSMRLLRFPTDPLISDLLDSPLAASLQKLVLPSHIGPFARRGIDIVHERAPATEA